MVPAQGRDSLENYWKNWLFRWMLMARIVVAAEGGKC